MLLGLSAGRPIRVIYKFEYFPRSFKYCCNSFPASGGADGLPNEPANSLRSRRLVWLLQAPSVDCTQERVGYSHLKQPALDTTRWTSHKKLLTSRCHYIYSKLSEWLQRQPGPKPGQNQGNGGGFGRLSFGPTSDRKMCVVRSVGANHGGLSQ